MKQLFLEDISTRPVIDKEKYESLGPKNNNKEKMKILTATADS